MTAQIYAPALRSRRCAVTLMANSAALPTYLGMRRSTEAACPGCPPALLSACRMSSRECDGKRF
eukprot:298805-Prymnesium_polylepis.1